MKTRLIGNSGIGVAEIGLGCMGMSEFYGPADEADSRATLERAHALGVTLFDTADMYGFGHNERLLSAFLKAHPAVRIATKFAIVREPGSPSRRIDNSPAYIASACEASLERLGVEVIDLYYAHRINREQPIEETIGAMAALVKVGKVRALGLCEVSAATLRRAHAVHTQLAQNDFRRLSPRFQGGNLAANLALVDALKKLAAEKRCTPGQLALAWLLHQGPDIIPIPGTRRIRYLEENVAAADIGLSAADLAAMNAALPVGAAAGDRYPAAGMASLDA